MRFLKSFGAAVGYLAIYAIVIIIVTVADMSFDSLTSPAEASQTAEALSGSVAEGTEINYELYMIIVDVVCLVAYGFIIKARKKSIRERLDLKPFSIKKAAMLLMLGILLNILITYALSLLPIPEGTMSEYGESVSSLDTQSFIGVINAIIMAPIFEEVMTRGLIMKSLMGGMPVALALIMQALLFGLLHGQIVWVVYAAGTGFLLGLVRLRCGSLFACILLHFSLNASNYILDPLFIWVGDNALMIYGVLGISLVAAFLLIRGVLKKEPGVAMEPLDDMVEPV